MKKLMFEINLIVTYFQGYLTGVKLGVDQWHRISTNHTPKWVIWVFVLIQMPLQLLSTLFGLIFMKVIAADPMGYLDETLKTLENLEIEEEVV